MECIRESLKNMSDEDSKGFAQESSLEDEIGFYFFFFLKPSFPGSTLNGRLDLMGCRRTAG